MAYVPKGAEPSGTPAKFTTAMKQLGFSKSMAHDLAKVPSGPPTFTIARTRYVDEGLLRAWFAAYASGEIEVPLAELRAVRGVAA